MVLDLNHTSGDGAGIERFETNNYFVRVGEKLLKMTRETGGIFKRFRELENDYFRQPLFFFFVRFIVVAVIRN